MAYTPPFPSLRFLQGKAHDLKRRYAAEDPGATRKVAKHWHGDLLPPGEFRLADSYRVLSRAFRAPDWATLKRGITLMQAIREGDKPVPTEAELDLLVTMLGAHHPVGGWAHRLLSTVGARGHAAVLRGLSHPTMWVRNAASGYLDHAITTWDDATYCALADAASDESPRVRGAVLHALGCQRCKTDPLNDEAVRLFLAGTHDASPRVRCTALAGLRNFAAQPQVRRAYIDALTDPSTRVRRAAASGLGACEAHADAFEALINQLRIESDAWVRRTALTSLGSLAKPATRGGLDAIRSRFGEPVSIDQVPGRPDCWFYPAERAAGLPDPVHATTWIRVIVTDRPAVSFHSEVRRLDGSVASIPHASTAMENV